MYFAVSYTKIQQFKGTVSRELLPETKWVMRGWLHLHNVFVFWRWNCPPQTDQGIERDSHALRSLVTHARHISNSSRQENGLRYEPCWSLPHPPPHFVIWKRQHVFEKMYSITVFKIQCLATSDSTFGRWMATLWWDRRPEDLRCYCCPFSVWGCF